MVMPDKIRQPPGATHAAIRLLSYPSAVWPICLPSPAVSRRKCLNLRVIGPSGHNGLHQASRPGCSGRLRGQPRLQPDQYRSQCASFGCQRKGNGQNRRAAPHIQNSFRLLAVEQVVQGQKAAARGAVVAGAKGLASLDFNADSAGRDGVAGRARHVRRSVLPGLGQAGSGCGSPNRFRAVSLVVSGWLPNRRPSSAWIWGTSVLKIDLYAPQLRLRLFLIGTDHCVIISEAKCLICSARLSASDCCNKAVETFHVCVISLFAAALTVLPNWLSKRPV